MIRVEGLTKSYEDKSETAEPAITNLSFENETGRFLTLLGPSGCGKSTTLRCIAGLETPDAGVIEIGGKVVFSAVQRIDLSPARRRIGMVFQSYAIWPHMTVLENVVYPLRFSKMSAGQRNQRAHQVLEIVGLDALSDRSATRLSGGQQQRVALARALVGEPEVLLLDEPLSNLDAALRRELGGYVRNLQQALGLTVIYVTHDQGEALSMSDAIALLDRGRIMERGHPEELFSRPGTHFGASFLGDANFLDVYSLQSGPPGFADTAEGRLQVASLPDGGLSEQASVMIRPQSIRLYEDAPSLPDEAANRFRCEVVDERFFGGYREYRLRTGNGWTFTAHIQGGPRIEPHRWVFATVDAANCVLVTNPNRSTRPSSASVGVGEESDEQAESDDHTEPDELSPRPLLRDGNNEQDRPVGPDKRGGITMSRRRLPSRWIMLLAAVALMAAACDGDGGATTTGVVEEPTTEATTAPATEPEEDVTTTANDGDGGDPLAELAAEAEAEGGSLEYAFVLGEEYLGPLVDAFRERYPFAEVNITTAGTLQLIERILTENETGNPTLDMVQGGPLEDSVLCQEENLCFEFVPEGVENVPDELAFTGQPFVVPAYFTFHVAYNTEAVSEDEVPTSLADFAEPQWEGRFGIDQEVIDWFAAELAYYGEEEGLALFESLAANNPVVYSGAQGYEQLAAGALPASINAYSLLLPQYIEAGAPIAVAQTDHMIALPDEFIGINTTDNPALLSLWMEWLFTEEAQQIQPDHLGKTPVLEGISAPDALTQLSQSCTGDCELFFGTSENFGDFDQRVEQFQSLFSE